MPLTNLCPSGASQFLVALMASLIMTGLERFGRGGQLVAGGQQDGAFDGIEVFFTSRSGRGGFLDVVRCVGLFLTSSPVCFSVLQSCLFFSLAFL